MGTLRKIAIVVLNYGSGVARSANLATPPPPPPPPTIKRGEDREIDRERG